jgi:hypothetical protein
MCWHCPVFIQPALGTQEFTLQAVTTCDLSYASGDPTTAGAEEECVVVNGEEDAEEHGFLGLEFIHMCYRLYAIQFSCTTAPRIINTLVVSLHSAHRKARWFHMQESRREPLQQLYSRQGMVRRQRLVRRRAQWPRLVVASAYPRHSVLQLSEYWYLCGHESVYRDASGKAINPYLCGS